MKSNRVPAIIFSLLMIFSLTSCKDNQDIPMAQINTTTADNTVYETYAETVLNTDALVIDSTAEYSVQEIYQTTIPEVTTTQPQTTATQPQTTTTPVETTAPAETTTELLDDPANWATERIVEEYKNAAIKSDSSIKSTQKISIKKISVNDGEHENVMSFITAIIAKFLDSNSTQKEGITGGYTNLTAQDVSSAKAYKSGEDTAIEMIMVEQISGAKEDALSGSVGHAITAVGDIYEVVNDLAERGLPLELSEEDTKIYYTNPTVKVVINNDGVIVSGTWSYTVEIQMNNFKAFGQNVEKASITMENTITV